MRTRQGRAARGTTRAAQSRGSDLDKKAYGADILVCGIIDVPAAGAGDIPADLQADLMPAVGKQGGVAASGEDAIAVEQEPGMWVVVLRGGELQLADGAGSHGPYLLSVIVH